MPPTAAEPVGEGESDGPWICRLIRTFVFVHRRASAASSRTDVARPDGAKNCLCGRVKRARPGGRRGEISQRRRIPVGDLSDASVILLP